MGYIGGLLARKTCDTQTAAPVKAPLVRKIVTKAKLLFVERYTRLVYYQSSPR